MLVEIDAHREVGRRKTLGRRDDGLRGGFVDSRSHIAHAMLGALNERRNSPAVEDGKQGVRVHGRNRWQELNEIARFKFWMEASIGLAGSLARAGRGSASQPEDERFPKPLLALFLDGADVHGWRGLRGMAAPRARA